MAALDTSAVPALLRAFEQRSALRGGNRSERPDADCHRKSEESFPRGPKEIRCQLIALLPARPLAQRLASLLKD
jgi:hypothetical protein